MLDRMLLAAGGEEKLYVEDVFSTYLYTGDYTAKTITNGIDLAGKGGLVWTKDRSLAQTHRLVDTANGGGKYLVSSSAGAAATFAASGLTNVVFYNNGYKYSNDSTMSAPDNMVSWTFRKAPKFFDVVTWTGDGSFTRTISHSLGIAPGCMIVKITSATGDWIVYHQGINGGVDPRYYSLRLNLTDAARGDSIWNYAAPTGSNFQVTDQLNASGSTYVAYLFAHDATAGGIIQCGSFTADSGGLASVNLGWEPQWVMVKSSGAVGSWQMMDTMRGWYNDSANPNDARLWANLTNVEQTTSQLGNPTATGFDIAGQGASQTYIYMAIRRGPMKTPTVGTSVFAPSLGSATVPLFGSGFPVDLGIYRLTRSSAADTRVATRLSGANYTITNGILADTADASLKFDYMNGFINSTGTSNSIGWLFKRAPGFCDVVCYQGTGVAGTVPHNLGAVPELMIFKSRSVATTTRLVYHASLGPTAYLILTSSNGSQSPTTSLNSTAPTSSVFSVGTTTTTNTSGASYIAYLFASCPGVSKVGTYTGNGSSQTINCGFTTGARFFLVKRTDSTGDWYVWDSARGIGSGFDPVLPINNGTSENTAADVVDPTSTGIIVKQEATCNINVNGATYIYLSVA